MKKFTVAVDSFKGSLSSDEVAEAVAVGVHKVFPDCEVVKVAVADGGEGTMEALASRLKCRPVEVVVKGPLMEPVTAKYAVSPDGYTAVMDMASASGLTLVPEELRNPLKTTSFGTGEMILDAVKRGCRRVLVGIGGSATNDGGLGMLTALGFRFYDSSGNLLSRGCGEDLLEVSRFDASGVPAEVWQTDFIVACDVNNPFCGPEGAAYVFARQKGADSHMIEVLDRGLSHFADVIASKRDVRNVEGAGAAGGLGGAFVAFLDAKLTPGIEMVLDVIGFDSLIAGSDLIITGEGKLDLQTCMGKAPAGVLRHAMKAGIPVIAIGGAVESPDVLNNAGFAAIFSIQPGPLSLDRAMMPRIAVENVEKTVCQIMRLLNLPLR